MRLFVLILQSDCASDIAHGIPASILLILRIGTGAVQGRYQKTRFGAGLSIGNWVLICRRSESSATGSGDVIDWGRGR